IEDIDPHLAQLRVHVRIVDDLADEENLSVGELPPRLICVLDRALHTVAETELAGEPNGDVADGQRVVAIAQEIDELSLVGGELRLNLRFEAETLAKVRGGVRWRPWSHAGNLVGCPGAPSAGPN